MPVRAWFAQALGCSTAPRQPQPSGSSPARRSRHQRTTLEVEALEERTLLSGNGLTGHYYSGTNFNSLKLTRVDSTINEWWSGQAPTSNLAGTNFSVKWTGFVQPLYSQQYTFSVRSDDGARLFVNGQEIINDWTDHSSTVDSGSIRLVAGQKYSIEMDYFQATGSSVAALSWSSTSQAAQIVPTSALYTTATTPVPNPGPTAKATASNVTTAGATSYTFTVAYTDSDGVSVASLKTGNVLVTGPNGFSQVATLVSVNSSANGTPRTATYRITPPGGSWDVKDNGTYSIILQSGQVKDTKGDLSSGGVVGSFQVSAPGVDWFATNLKTPALQSLVRSDDADKSISRADMLGIFSKVESAGTVTATEFADLQTIANNSYLSMTADVRNLAQKVVDGDTANMHYQGHTLGNLHAGSGAVQLTDLASKWFLGTDLPAAPGATYVKAAGTLFGASGPVYTNIVQGNLGDCYFLAGLGEVALRDPNAIRNMFINNGDGTYTVRFYKSGTPTYVTVNGYLPESGGVYVYANYQEPIARSTNVLWVALAEKAYAQLAESGWSRPSATTNSYNSINLGWEGDAVHQIDNKVENYNSVTNSVTSLNSIVSAFNSGKMIGIDSKPTTSPNIVPSHVYIMVGYNASTHVFSLYNPWGSVQQLSAAQVAANFEGWSVNS